MLCLSSHIYYPFFWKELFIKGTPEAKLFRLKRLVGCRNKNECDLVKSMYDIISRPHVTDSRIMVQLMDVMCSHLWIWSGDSKSLVVKSVSVLQTDTSLSHLQVSEDRPSFGNSHHANGPSCSHHLCGHLGGPPDLNGHLHPHVSPHPETPEYHQRHHHLRWPPQPTAERALQNRPLLLRRHLPLCPRLANLLLLQHVPSAVAAEGAGVVQLQEAHQVPQEHVGPGHCLLHLLCPVPLCPPSLCLR